LHENILTDVTRQLFIAENPTRATKDETRITAVDAIEIPSRETFRLAAVVHW
jgi:hypothetical protein